MQMLREDALAVARVVEEAFAGHSELEDDALAPDLRQVFYDLQDAKVLDVKRHEYQREGQVLRGYRWHVVDEDARPESSPLLRPADPVASVYDSLQDGAWERRRPQV